MEKAPGLRACRCCLLAALLGCFMLNIQLANANKKDSVRTSRQAPDPAEGVPLGGIWGPWGPWSSCTKSCGLGIAERRRTCLSPLPEPLQPWRDSYPPSRLGTPIQRGYGAVVSAVRPPEYPPSHPLFMSSPENRQAVPRNPRPQHSPAANQGPVSIYRDAQDVAVFYRPDFPPAHQERLPLYRQDSPLEEQRAGARLNPPPAQEDTARRLRPYQDGSANRGAGGGNRRSVSANQEPRSSRRPPPHSSIQPGRYGYGKVPFALPLHRSSDRRSRRARHGKENETEGRGDPQSETEGRGDPQSETEGRGDPQSETEGRGDPQSETEGRGDPQNGTETALLLQRTRRRRRRREEGSGQERRVERVEVSDREGGDGGDSSARSRGGGGREEGGVREGETREGGVREEETQLTLRGQRDRGEGDSERGLGEGTEAGVEVLERGEQGGGEPSRHSQDTQEPRQDRTRTRPKPRPGAAMSSIPVSGDTDRTRSQGGAPVEADQRPSSRAPHRPAPRPPQPSGQHHHWGSSSSSSSRGGYSHHRYSDPWLPHSRDPSNLFRGERGPLASSGLGPSAQSHANWELYRPASASPAYLCHGPQSEHKTCNLEACPGGAVDLRAAQCSGFNSQEFMGRRYEWEPFLEAGGGYQRCELNCRPVGFRFYVRHAERVWDGTPCQGNSSALCITGRCLSPGCDGVLGSNLTLDSCGVCGGDGATCRRVAGTFQNSSVPIGYHQFLKIPPGATRITITERERSPNYLALRTGSGLSVINGRWAVDPPGQYEAGGTLFQYRRGGAGGEMLTAPGPTTTVLLVYIIFHKKNPGIDYEFYLPAERRRAEELEREQRERQGFSALTLVSPPGPLQTPLVAPPLREASPAPLSRGSARNVRIPPRTDLPPQSLPDFLWRRAGLTDCSASCGKGFQFPVFQCVSRKTQQEVEDRKCDPTAKPAPVEEACNVQPCPAFWEAGAWSGCSQSCGPGEQQRQVQCRQVYGAHSTMVHPQLCSSLLRPNSTQPCQLRVCSHWEIRSNWSSCSVMCGQGQRTRSVRCVSTHGATVSEGECSAGLRPRGNEACNMGPCVHSWLSSDWSNTCSVECGTGVQRRSVVCLASRADGPSEQSCGGARPAELRACSGGACQPSTRWYTGPWSECNVECGNGTQRRDIICVNKLGADFNVTPARDCAHLEKLPSVQECSAGPCRAKWYTTQWSACSRSCVGGVQAREVRCLTEDRALSQQCDPDLKPAEKQSCNTQPCTGETDENCRDTHHSCPLVVQARLCVYSYYRTVCCAACERGAERSKRQRERERERDTETQRDRERETQRERDTERERHTETQRDRERETQRERDRERERQRERDTERERHRERERHTETQRHTERHRDTLRDTETH